jgi:hypothetical protein
LQLTDDTKFVPTATLAAIGGAIYSGR